MERITRKDILREIVNTVSFVILMALLGFIFLILLPAYMNIASASTIDNRCQPLYEQFLQSETYDQAGESAWQMMELNCWPALQGTQQTAEYVSPTDCNSLGSHIMSRSPESGWAKVYEPKSVAYWNIEGGAEERIRWRADPKSALYRKAINNPYGSTENKRKIQVINNAEAPPGGTRALECLAKVRTDQGYQTVYYYLDNDDGDEFWGYLHLRD